jgi:hypothetical protein
VPKRLSRAGSKSGRAPGPPVINEFIPLSFWYDAPLRSRDSDRRHALWLVYGLPSYRLARGSAWISPVCPSTSFSPWSRPARTRSPPGWPRGGWRGHRGRRAAVPSLSPAPCRPRQSGGGSAWSPSNPLPSRGCTGADAGWARAQPRRGCPGPHGSRATAGCVGGGGGSYQRPAGRGSPPSASVAGPPSPLVPMTAPHGASAAPKPLLPRRTARAGSQKPTRSSTSCAARLCSAAFG